jgi:hypothetical protein
MRNTRKLQNEINGLGLNYTIERSRKRKPEEAARHRAVMDVKIEKLMKEYGIH